MAWPAPTGVAVVRISTRSGAVHVVADPDQTEVWSSVRSAGGEGPVTTIDSGSSTVRVRVPEGTDLVVGSTSGRVKITGRVGDVSALTKSGRISIERARSVDARSGSGRVDIGWVAGDARAVTSSGRVDIDRCAAATVTAGNGRIVVSEAHGAVRAHSTSGRIKVRLAGAHDVDAETVSGRVSVELPPGVRPLLAESMSEIDGTPSGHDCVVVARSGSGRVDVTNR